MKPHRATRVLAALVALAPFAAADRRAAEDGAFTAADASPGDAAGQGLAADGTRALVGVPGDDGPFGPDAGSVRVLERGAGGTWSEVAAIRPPDAFAGDQFGYAVALDGDRALIGAPGDDDGGSASGSAYVYERAGGGTWVMVAKLHAPDASLGDFFGRAVALDGDVAVVGAPLHDHGEFNAGAAFVYERSSGGTWNFVHECLQSGRALDDRAGTAVAVRGHLVAVGAPLSDAVATDGGSVALYAPGVGGAWSQVGTAHGAAAAPTDQFGSAVHLTATRLVVGAPGDDADADDAGSVRVLEPGVGGTWSQVARLAADVPAAGDALGTAVDARDGRIVGGAPGRVTPAGASGAVLAFDEGPGAAAGLAVELVPERAAQALGRAVAFAEADVLAGAPLDDGAAADGGALVQWHDGTLFRSRTEVGLASGGASSLVLAAGPASAGRIFVVAGSASGTTPGFDDPVSGLHVPLVVDAYTLFLVNNAGAGVVAPWFGVLDGLGRGESAFQLPAGTNPALAGTVVHHACLLLHPGTFGLEFVTEAVAVELAP